MRHWLKEKEEEQSQLEPYQTPAFTSEDVAKKMAKVEKLMKRINTKRPPKTKAPPANATENATTTTNSTVSPSVYAILCMSIDPSLL